MNDGDELYLDVPEGKVYKNTETGELKLFDSDGSYITKIVKTIVVQDKLINFITK
jgi:hypothetical protein